MNVLSLFDGMSCGMLALKQAGVKVDKYIASEIDKYADAVSRYNFPEIERLGDVVWINGINLPKIDLLIGGSPCQNLSSAGNRKGLKGGKSQLFWEFVRLKKECKPRYFLLENVASMKKSDRDFISKVMKRKPIMINSALVSAQQRKRLFWTNIPKISQPEDKKIYLKDILESGDSDRLKSYCITSTYGNACLRDYFEKNQRQLVFDKPDRVGHIGRVPAQANRVYSTNGKSVNLTGNGGGGGAKTGLYLCCASRGRNIVDGKRKDVKGAKTIQRLEFRNDKKTNCLTRVQKDNYVAIIQRGRGNNKGGIKAENGKTPALTSSKWEYNNHLLDGFTVRKLTPIECERLQTVPDNFTSKGNFNGVVKDISKTQRYKMLGNGWTVDVISHIFKNIKE